jgi:TPR repeat protein
MKKIFILLSLCLFCSCQSNDDEEDPYEDMTQEEEFAARNEKVFDKGTDKDREEYLANMRAAQDSGQVMKDEEVTDYAVVLRKMSRQAYERTLAQAELGDEDACYQMAMIHKYGYYGPRPNIALCKKWLKNAADLGSIKARHQLRYLERSR